MQRYHRSRLGLRFWIVSLIIFALAADAFAGRGGGFFSSRGGFSGTRSAPVSLNPLVSKPVSLKPLVSKPVSPPPRVHGNSRYSVKPTHLYEIKNKQTREVHKYGISSGKTTPSGKSVRAELQVRALNGKTRGPYQSRIVAKNLTRDQALRHEKGRVNSYSVKAQATGKAQGPQGPVGNISTATHALSQGAGDLMGKFLRRIDYECSAGLLAQQSTPFEFIYLVPMYETCLPPIATSGIAKVRIHLTHLVEQDKTVEILGDVIRVYRFFDREEYSSLSSSARKAFCLDAIHGCLVDLAVARAWPQQSLDAACTAIRERNYVFAGYHGKSQPAPRRDRSIRIGWEFEWRLILFIEVSGKGAKTVRRHEVGSFAPSLGVLKEVLGDLRWIDDDSFQITHSNGKDYWRYTASLDALYFHSDRPAVLQR